MPVRFENALYLAVMGSGLLFLWLCGGIVLYDLLSRVMN